MKKKGFVSLLVVMAILLISQVSLAEDVLSEEGYTKQSNGYKTVVHWAESNGYRVYGEFYIPDDIDMNAPNPIIILCPGFSGNIKSISYYSNRLAQEGYLCYAFDFVGGSLSGRSEGDMLDMSIVTEVADLENVMADLCEYPYIDGNRIILMGVSQGGAVSALTGAMHPDMVCGEVLVYPAFSIADNFIEMYQDIENVPDEGLEFLSYAVGKQYVTDIWYLDMIEEASQYVYPVLIMHGTDDDIIPYEYSVKAAEAYPDAELITVEGAGHMFSINIIEELIPSILNYIENAIQ